jgi:hypothetical protein
VVTPRSLVARSLFSTTTPISDTMDNIHISLAENIALLSLLSTVPEVPIDNIPNGEAQLASPQTRSLTFERERVSPITWHSYQPTRTILTKVTVVCVEENLDNSGLKVLLAVNKGSIAPVKTGFENMFKILERVVTQGKCQPYIAHQVLR